MSAYTIGPWTCAVCGAPGTGTDPCPRHPTREHARETALDAAVRHHFDALHAIRLSVPFDRISDRSKRIVRGQLRGVATAAADAVLALFPPATPQHATTEWGVRYDDGRVNGPTTREMAEYLTTRDDQTFPLVTREVTDWTEVHDA